MFTIDQASKIQDALRLIDKNQSGFVLVCNKERKLLCTLTDDDIRRALVNGSSITDSANGIYRDKYKYLNTTDNIGDAIELFKNYTIKFLPIVDMDRVLVNLITKAQLHVVLLQDINADLSYSFDELDDSVLIMRFINDPGAFIRPLS